MARAYFSDVPEKQEPLPNITPAAHEKCNKCNFDNEKFANEPTDGIKKRDMVFYLSCRDNSTGQLVMKYPSYFIKRNKEGNCIGDRSGYQLNEKWTFDHWVVYCGECHTELSKKSTATNYTIKKPKRESKAQDVKAILHKLYK